MNPSKKIFTLKFVNCLLFKLSPSNYSYQTALHRAVLVDSPEITELLITRGADINTGDRDGVTPLALANRFMAKKHSSIMTDA